MTNRALGRRAPRPGRVLLPLEPVDRSILLVRGQRVILDADLAAVYGVSTKRLNEQVKRNPGRFPADFVFRLSRTEKAEVVANCDHLRRLRFAPGRPLAFTEHGAIMAANVLNSGRAVTASVLVVRAFVRLRRLAPSYADLARKLDGLEEKYDDQFKDVFAAIRGLMAPRGARKPKPRPIGFARG